MSAKTGDILQKDDVTQAVLIADDFEDAFVPVTNDTPLALLPLVNKPLIEYSLEFLALARIEETFLFCCSHADAIRRFVQSGKDKKAVWSQTMEVTIIVSESCRSFGDCMRDLDAKGLIRGNFVLAEAGAISNMKLLPIIKIHNNIMKKDKTAAMTMIFEEAGLGRCPQEEVLIATNSLNRLLFYRKPGLNKEKKVDFPLEVFLENSKISIQHNLKDTHVAVCSPNVLPLFSDNFDYQTRNDLVKGLLMFDEVLDSTLYVHTIGGGEHAGTVNGWSTYRTVSQELIDRWFYPIVPTAKKNRTVGDGAVVGSSCKISKTARITRSILGDDVVVSDGAVIEDSFVMSRSKIDKNCTVKHSFVGSGTEIGAGSKVTFGSILGTGVVIPKETTVHDSLVQAEPGEDAEEKIGPKAFLLKPQSEDESEGYLPDKQLIQKFSRLHVHDVAEESDDENDDTSDSEDGMSYTNSPVPDDTNLFFTEVTDSLARGFEDKLLCDNLILEINSSRYAYNVTLKEVHYNVVKAILNLPFQQFAGPQYLQGLCRYLLYFSPILKNYIRNEDAMADCLQALEDVAASNNELYDCVSKVLNWFYDKDHLSEDSILQWHSALDENSRLKAKIAPFVEWLQEAEEASSSEEE